MHDHLHRVDEALPVGRRDQIGDVGHRRRRIPLGQRLIARQQQPRPYPVAAFGDQRRNRGELQRRRQHIALPDAHIDRVAGIPRLAFGAALPHRIRQPSRQRVGHVDRRVPAVAELRRARDEIVDLEPRREIEEVHVRRAIDGAREIDDALAAAVALRPAPVAIDARLARQA